VKRSRGGTPKFRPAIRFSAAAAVNDKLYLSSNDGNLLMLDRNRWETRGDNADSADGSPRVPLINAALGEHSPSLESNCCS